MAGFLLSLGLLLLAVVDIRRGFLFPKYFKVGVPSVLLNLNWGHLPLFLIAGIGLWLSYRYLVKFEKNLKQQKINLNNLAKILAVVIGVLLVIDLFTYRGVPASRNLAAGKMGVGTGPMGLGRAIPVASFPEWLQPVGDGVSYLLVVWHATTLGMLLGGLFLVAGAGLVTRLQNKGFIAHATGSALSLAQPFCSCCAAPVGSALYRKGASLGPTLAFIVSAPMLNITSLILSAALLPTEFAILRIAGGILIGVFLTYGISLLVTRWVSREEPEEKNNKAVDWSTKILSAYSKLFNFDKFVTGKEADSPSSLISSWLRMAWQLARVMVPVLLVGAIIAAYIVKVMPVTGNNFLGIGITAFFGTLLMVPTWTEIPFAAALANNGLTGIAAVALITLPAVSLPCLAVIAGSVRSFRVALILGLSVFIVGIIAGIIFI